MARTSCLQKLELVGGVPNNSFVVVQNAMGLDAAAWLVLDDAAPEWTQVLYRGALVLGKVERNPQHLHPPPEVAAIAATLVCTLVCTLVFAASPWRGERYRQTPGDHATNLGATM